MKRVLHTIAILTLAFIAACDGDDDPPSTHTPDASPTPGASATPPSGAIELRVGDPIDFPEDLAIIISTGCWQCDGPTESLVRLRRTPSEIERRILFDDAPPGGSITGFAFDVATGRAAISTCAPNCTGLGEITGTEQTVFHLSTDNGATFTPSDAVEGWFSIAGYTGGSLLISGPIPSALGSVRTYPAMTDVPTPDDDADAYPLASEVLWARIDPVTHERTALLASDGSVLFASAGDNISRVASLDTDGSRIAMLLYREVEAEEDESGYRLFIGKRDGSKLEHERTVASGFLYAGAALDECTIVANAELPAGSFPTPDTQGAFAGFLPSIIDICDGVIHPIVDPFTREPYLNGRNLITAVQTGPLFSVPDDIGDCLNVRESPSTDAPSLGCFAAGVLLRDSEESQDAGGLSWRRVTTPAGDEGWASQEFLVP